MKIARQRLYMVPAATAIALTLFAFGGPGSCAQTSQVPLVENSMAVYARAHMLHGKVAFDPRSTFEKGTASPRRTAEVTALASSLGADIVADQSRHLACQPRPRSFCRIVGADMIVSMNRPAISGDTAYVFIRILTPTIFPRMPISDRVERMLLEKRNGSWVVIGPVGGGSIN